VETLGYLAGVQRTRRDSAKPEWLLDDLATCLQQRRVQVQTIELRAAMNETLNARRGGTLSNVLRISLKHSGVISARQAT
jgi:hypothetical protein